MKKLELIRYSTMNSWNGSMAPAYNLKIYNVIPKSLQNKVFELMECGGEFYQPINDMIHAFQIEHDFSWQAGFNGRSGGYLVLYKGGYKEKILYPESEFNNTNYGGRVYADGYGWKSKSEAKQAGLLNKKVKQVFCWAGRSVDNEEVPEEVLQSFQRLAENIIQYTINTAKNSKIIEEEYTVIKTKKVLSQ